MMPPDIASMVQVNLRFGRDRARKLGELAEDMGVPRRVIEQSIESLRKDGVPVCTAGDGAWLALEADEVRACADRLNRRLRSQYLTVRALRATARRMAGVRQTELWAS